MTSTGGVYFVSDNLQIRDIGGKYENNSAISGSVYYCEGCNVVSINNTYKSNVCLRGCIMFYKPTTASLQLTQSSPSVVNKASF